MPPEISEMSNSLLIDPAKISVTPAQPTVEAIEQFVYFVDKVNKKKLLLHVLHDKSIVSALVFTRTKHGADRVVHESGAGQYQRTGHSWRQTSKFAPAGA